MIQCFDTHQQSFFTCSTTDKNIFTCKCCQNAGNIGCKQHFFENSFYMSRNKISDTSPQDAMQNSNINTNIEQDGGNLLDGLFSKCTSKNILPFWCEVHKSSRNTTLCGCTNQKGYEEVDNVHFNSSDVWTRYPCDITEEYHHVLQSAQINLILSIFMYIVLVLILFIIGYFLIKKIIKLCNSRKNFNENILCEE